MKLSKSKYFIVTGGLGFIGSHFIDLLLKKGHKVLNIDKVSYASNKLDFGNHENYSFLQEDIAKIKDIPDCDFIVNFAAESHVDNSIASSFEFINSNVLGVYNLLEIIKNKKIFHMQKAWEYKTPLFLQISTDEVFGDIEEGSFREDDRHKPSNPYAASKSAAEQLLVAWSRTYQIPYVITRTTNNYGPRQHFEKLIPKAITSLINEEKIPVHGSGTHVRNWIHVEDNVNAIYQILDTGKENTSYHISSDEELSVKQIVEKISKKFNRSFSESVQYSSDRSGADVRYSLDSSKTKNLGWKLEKTIDSSLEEMINFYKERKLQ